MRSLLLMAILVLPTLQTTAPAKKDKSQPPLAKFDSSLSALPENYTGHFAELTVAYSARSKQLAKSEFETSGEYELRIGQLNAQVRKAVGGSPPYAIVVRPVIRYDADQSRFVISLLQTYGLGRNRELVASAERPGQSYLAENNFGVKRNVQRIFREEFYVNIANPTALPILDPPADYGMRLRMPRDTAVKYKDTLRLLIIGDVADPYYREENLEEQPTLDRLTHVYRHVTSLSMTVAGIWLFDQPTGHIWAKWQAKEGPK